MPSAVGAKVQPVWSNAVKSTAAKAIHRHIIEKLTSRFGFRPPAAVASLDDSL
jgi:hypothetical protein